MPIEQLIAKLQRAAEKFPGVKVVIYDYRREINSEPIIGVDANTHHARGHGTSIIWGENVLAITFGEE